MHVHRGKIVVAGFPAFSYMFTVGTIGFWLPLYVQEILGYTHSMTEYLATAYFVALSLGSIASGSLTDRTGKPQLTAFSGLVINAATIWLMGHTESFPIMLLLRVIQGLGLSTAIPVALGSLSLIAGESMGVGLTSLFMSSGMALGSLVGGLIVQFYGYPPLFSAASLVSLLGGIVALSLRVKPETRPPRLRELARLLRGEVLVVLVGIFMRQTLATGVYALLAVILKLVLHLSLVETTIALTVNPLVQGVLSMAIARRTQAYSRLMYPSGVALTGIVFTLLAASTGRPLLAIFAMILQGASFAMVNIAGNYIVITGLPREMRYTASSLFNTFFNLGWISGTLLAGIALQSLSPIEWIKLSAILLEGLAVIIYLGLSMTRRTHSPEPLPDMHA